MGSWRRGRFSIVYGLRNWASLVEQQFLHLIALPLVASQKVRNTPTWYGIFRIPKMYYTENSSFIIKYVLLPVRTVRSVEPDFTLGHSFLFVQLICLGKVSKTPIESVIMIIAGGGGANQPHLKNLSPLQN